MGIHRQTLLPSVGLLGLVAHSLAAPPAAAGEPCRALGFGSPAREIAECHGGYDDPERLGRALERELGLPAATAARLARALAAREAAFEREGRPSAAETRPVEAEFINLLSGAPGDPRLREEVAWFYADGRHQLETPSSALLEIVETSADPTGLALTLTELCDPRPLCLDIILAAAAARPEQPLLWHRAAELTIWPAWQSAFREESFRQLPSPPQDPRAAAAAAGSWIGGLLDAGLTRQAIAAFAGLADPVRALVEQGAEGKVEAKIGNLPFAGELRDLRIDLAAAHLLEGDLEKARAIVSAHGPARSLPAPWLFADHQGVTRDDGVRALLERRLAPSADDPFDLFAAILAKWHMSNDAATGWRVLARVAEHEGYPVLAAYALWRAAFPPARAAGPFTPGRPVPARIEATARTLETAADDLCLDLMDAGGALETRTRASLGPDPSATTIARLLGVPPRTTFAEQPLPEGLSPVDRLKDLPKGRRKAMRGLTLPPGIEVVRAEREGSKVVVIAVSRDYETNVSPGAYWVHLSDDGGATWSRPLYTGLRIQLPYLVRELSALPLLAADRLQLEVEVQEIDPSSVTFPDMGLAVIRREKGLYLDIPLAELRRDTDRDGLTDLAEERLLLDPEDSDTDGDGIGDAGDPLPSVPWSDDRSAAANALAAFVASAEHAGLPAVLEEGSPLPRSRLRGEETTFLVGDRALLTALRTQRRMVVLTPDEARAVRERLGLFFPFEIELFMLDRSGRRAYVVWSNSGSGGQSFLEERDGAWIELPASFWIS